MNPYEESANNEEGNDKDGKRHNNHLTRKLVPSSNENATGSSSNENATTSSKQFVK